MTNSKAQKKTMSNRGTIIRHRQSDTATDGRDTPHIVAISSHGRDVLIGTL